MYGYNHSIIDGLVKTNSVDDNEEVYKKYVKLLCRNIGIPLKYERRFKNKIACILYFISPSIMSKAMLKRNNRRLKSGD